ncbi:MAG: (d)CMP kinase [Sediminispirochaetaceae bacterium]
MIIALDGPAGVGKSSVAKRVAELLNIKYINSGNLYRAVTWAVLERPDVDISSEHEVTSLAQRLSFSLIDGQLCVDGKPVEEYLHTDRVDEKVAEVSSFPPVREIVNNELRGLTSDIDAVVEGRDISTVVFPDAEFKIFLDASVETRAERRYSQGTSDLGIEEIKERIRRRDGIDAHKKIGRMALARDAVYIDTSHLTIDQVCEKVIDTVKKEHQ